MEAEEDVALARAIQRSAATVRPPAGQGRRSPRDTLTRNRHEHSRTGHETMPGGFGDAQKIRSRGERRPCPAGRREVVEVEPRHLAPRP